MVFSSNIFLLYFMPAFFLVYFLTPRKARNYVLLLASLIFYAWGAPEFIIQLVASTVANFFLVKWMCKTDKKGLKKLLCALSIIIPLGLLIFYKYGNFTMENLNAILGLTGHAPLTWKRIMLPIGISFFSFQSVTYTLDTYRGVNKPMEKLTDFVLYITMFPQLIAGPIVRASHLVPAMENLPGTETRLDTARAGVLILAGLIKKMVIADYLAANLADPLFAMPEEFGTIDALMGVYAYTLQIYCDFSAYSDIAIGCALLLGFEFPINFDAPYFSDSFKTFWRRWHISLSSWLRDYLYIPLGGSRRGKAMFSKTFRWGNRA